MAEKIYNRVVFDGRTLIDLTGDTVEAGNLKVGIKAHDASGAQVTGTFTQDATATAANILTGYSAYVNGLKVEGTMPNNNIQTDTISTKSGSVAISAGYHASGGSVSINTSAVADLQPSNVRQGKTILGIQGTMTGSESITAEEKTVTPTTSSQEILPTSADYLSKVTVAAIPYSEELNGAGGYTATIG